MPSTDGIKLDGPDAILAMALALSQAGRMFEVVPDSKDARARVEKAVQRIAEDSHVVKASLAFYDRLYEAYEQMKRDD